MSDPATWSKALGWMVAVGTLAGCGDSIPVDLFASRVGGNGECSGVDCQTIEDARRGGTGGASAPDAEPHDDAATASGAVGSGGDRTDAVMGGPTTDASGGAAAGMGGGAAAGAGSAGAGGAGVAGTGGATDAGEMVVTDAGQGLDRTTPDDVDLRDVVAADRVERDACVPRTEVCDGLDNNCNGSVDEQACPTGCIGMSSLGSGYMFCYAQGQRRNWLAAETECENRGMHLAEVDDAVENAFIRRVMRSVGFDGNVWLGGSDQASEGRWVWTDGTQFWVGGANGSRVGGNYTNWSIGQPNAGHIDADCNDMAQGVDTWHDEQCGLLQAFMCEGS